MHMIAVGHQFGLSVSCAAHGFQKHKGLGDGIFCTVQREQQKDALAHGLLLCCAAPLSCATACVV